LSTPVVPLTTVEIDETEPPSLPNRTVPFSCFEQELLTPCSIHVPTGSISLYDDSVGGGCASADTTAGVPYVVALRALWTR
jgi:hypothetical protein